MLPLWVTFHFLAEAPSYTQSSQTVHVAPEFEADWARVLGVPVGGELPRVPLLTLDMVVKGHSHLFVAYVPHHPFSSAHAILHNEERWWIQKEIRRCSEVFVFSNVGNPFQMPRLA